jgi:hypothetical protein
MAVLTTSKYTSEQRAARQLASAAWKARNPERVAARANKPEARAYRVNWVKNNKDKVCGYSKKWREANHDQIIAMISLWKKRNPDKVKEMDAAKAAKRRAIKYGSAVHPEHDRSTAKELHSTARRLTKETGIIHHVDHVIPLCAGGFHHHDNLQILTQSENCRKNSNPFWRKDGFKSFAEVSARLWPQHLMEQYNNILSEESMCLS